MKRCVDVIGSVVGLIVFSPVMVCAAIAILLDSGSPVLFSQKRVGLLGKPFLMWKFRTMRANVDSSWVRERDERVTRVGAFLRRTSLDELPQFFNVLAGSMSLVGPRPEMESYAAEFAQKIPEYSKRHLVKPGITGYAQIYGSRTYGPEEIADILQFDLTYVKRASLLLDIELLFRTATGFLFQRAR